MRPCLFQGAGWLMPGVYTECRFNERVAQTKTVVSPSMGTSIHLLRSLSEHGFSEHPIAYLTLRGQSYPSTQGAPLARYTE